MITVEQIIEHYLLAVDAAWRFLRQGDVDSAHKAATAAERWHDELVGKIGPRGYSFKFVGNLIVGVKQAMQDEDGGVA